MDLDCLIVGGGPAGLTAATYLGRFRRNVLLVDGGDSRARWIPVSHNILGFSNGVTGPQLLAVLRAQCDRYSVRRITACVETLTKDKGSFRATFADGSVSAARILLATGGLDIEPEVSDAYALVKEGLIRHCPICDAYEAMGKSIALVAYGRCRVKEALLIRGYTSDLTVLTLGHPAKMPPSDVSTLEEAGIRICHEPIDKIARVGDKIAAWPRDRPAPLLFDTIYSALGMHLRSELAALLGAEVDEDGALLVDRHQQTSVPGLYAAGDVVHGLSQVSVAAGQAAIAATAINASLPPRRFGG